MTSAKRLVLTALAFAAPVAFAQEHWVATWAASPQETRALTPPAGQGRGAQNAGRGATNGQAAFTPPIMSFSDQTVRMIVRTSIGGRRARVEFSNAFGAKAVTIGAAHAALHDKESSIVAGSDRALTFGGSPSFAIPPGALAISDPVDLDVPRFGDLVISVYIPGETGPPTMHSTGLHTTYISDKGDQTAATDFTAAKTSHAWYWISGVDVLAPADTGVVVAFGDSITDGATSTNDADKSWPSLLAQRLAAVNASVAIVNEGISGNRLLRDQAGANALARFDRDVLSQPGVKWVTLLEGINDIGRATGNNPAQADGAVTANDLIGAMRQIIDRAHVHGVKVLGCTLTPYGGATYYSETGEAMREKVNDWIRSGGAFDAIVDFDAVVRDPANPKQIRADYNIRDHLHPNDAGYKAMADAIDLSIFGARSAASASAR